MKSDTVFKRAFNQTLDLLAGLATRATLPSENELSEQLEVSRTTVRKVLAGLAARGIVANAGRSRVVLKPRARGARYPEAETEATSAQVERHFMEWMLRGDTKPGAVINELELARQFEVGTTAIREFLNRFRRFGLIEKRPNAGWSFKGFTSDFALELFEIRELFELRSAIAFTKLAEDAPAWQKLRSIQQQHRELLREIDLRFHDFSALDDRFHRLIHEASPNRFIDDFHDIITLIFHYHYQWNKRDELERNKAAIGEHLEFIAGLLSRDRRKVEKACRRHLASARNTLLRSQPSST